jgi:protein-tyrosine phosphatase
MIKVLFVCKGNICRSPMAEGVFQHLIHQQGLADRFLVDSAATHDWDVGEPAHPSTKKILDGLGIRYTGRSRQITRDDLRDFQYVLAMDDSNLKDINRLVSSDSSAACCLFLDYAREAGLTEVEQVPDPYYTGQFEYVYQLVDLGTRALLAHLRQQHRL